MLSGGNSGKPSWACEPNGNVHNNQKSFFIGYKMPIEEGLHKAR